MPLEAVAFPCRNCEYFGDDYCKKCWDEFCAESLKKFPDQKGPCQKRSGKADGKSSSKDDSLNGDPGENREDEGSKRSPELHNKPRDSQTGPRAD